MRDDIEAALAADLTIDITTIGAKSGEPRRIEIWYIRVDGRYFITGTPFPRHWLANLRANPDFTFHLKESIVADLPAVAREVTDRATRERIFADPAASWYVGKASVADLVERAPTVEVTFPTLAP